MFKFTKVFGLSAGILALATMASCSNDNEPVLNPTESLSGSVLVSTPTIKAWSGEENFQNKKQTRSVAAGEAPAAVTADEVAAVKAAFNTLDNQYRSDLSIDVFKGWTNYYVQDVASDNRLSNDLAIFVGTNEDKILNIAIWDMDPDDVLKLLGTPDYQDNAAKVDVNPAETPLVVGHPIRDFSFETDGYSFNGSHITGVLSSGHKGQYGFSPNYKFTTLEGQEDAVYVALYGYTDQNNGFWNRIIKITKADVADVEEPEVEPGEEPEVIEGGNILHNNEVEVNLSINDTHRYYNTEDLTSKLSLHVRCNKDVKVRIPVPVEILVETDDLDIVMARPDLIEFGEKGHASFDIDGNTVELFVDFTIATDCAGNGYGCYIEVTTKGINQRVLDFCMDNYGDGVNFEVFNYYRWNVTDAEGNVVNRQPTPAEIKDLQEKWLNKSSVEFGYDNGVWNAYTNQNDYPWYYINAFKSDNDCVVKVISNQSGSFENSYVGAHLNGSDNNVIYVREDIYGSDRQDNAHVPN